MVPADSWLSPLSAGIRQAPLRESSSRAKRKSLERSPNDSSGASAAAKELRIRLSPFLIEIESGKLHVRGARDLQIALRPLHDVHVATHPFDQRCLI